MAEFEELKLTVTLTDYSAEGLVKLRQSLRDIGSTGLNDAALVKIQAEIEGMSRRMSRMTTEVSITARAVTALGRNIALALAAFATEFVSNFTINALRNFTNEMVRLKATSDELGVGAAQIKGIVDQMKLMGIESGAATSIVKSFAGTVATLDQMGSEARQKLITTSRRDPEVAKAFLGRITGFANKGDMIGALNEAIEYVDSEFARELERTDSEPLAAEYRNRLLESLGLDAATYGMLKGNRFKEITAEEEAKLQRRLQIALQFSREMAIMDEKWKAFLQGLQKDLIPLMEDFNKLAQDLSNEWGKGAGEAIAEGLKFVLTLAQGAAAILSAWSEIRDKVPPSLRSLLYSPLGFLAMIGPTGALAFQRYLEKRRKMVEEGSLPEPTAPPSNVKKMSYTGDGPIILPGGITRASFGGEDYSTSSDGKSALIRAIRVGTFEALIDFRDFMKGGAGGGGAQPAAYQPGGSGGYGGSAGSGGSSDRTGTPSGSNVGPGTGTGAGETPASGGAAGSGAAGRDALFDPITGKLGGGIGEPRPGGRRHQGDDISAPVGTAVYSSKDGVIDRVGTDNWGTPVITVRHPDGTYSRYMHLNAVGVKAGDKVKGGQQIGTSGVANRVPHLHYEIWRGKPNRPGSRMLNPREVHGWDKKNQPFAQRPVPGTGEASTTAKAPENNPAPPTAQTQPQQPVQPPAPSQGPAPAARPMSNGLTRASLDRDMGNEMNSRVAATGKLRVAVNAPAGTRVDASGGGMFNKVEMERRTPLPASMSA